MSPETPLQRIKAAKANAHKKLDLAGFELTEAPEEIGELSELRELRLQANNLTTLPECLGNLTKLKKLDLSSNNLASLPAPVLKLVDLEGLYLHANQLVSLPEAIGRFRELRELYLHRNCLASLPAAIGRLVSLRELSLQRNALTALPAEIGDLANLRKLYLDQNKLTSLPASLLRLQKLLQLFLHENPDLDLPAEILGPTHYDVYIAGESPASPAQILGYYFKACAAPRPLNEARLLVLGYGGAGKTSIINRLVNNDFDATESKTHGIRIVDWELLLDNDEHVRLHIWDFGGQEIVHATHQFFMTRRSLYLVVLSGRPGREDAEAKYWLDLIASFARNSPVIVVLNKINDQPFVLNERALRQAFPNVRAFVKTDCADGEGIEKLRQTIESETRRLDGVRDLFPSSWFAIKDKLSKMKENYIPFEAYRRICVRNGEPDPRAQERLAEHLHRLGVVLNYRDDHRLKDTQILNPQWVTNGIYTILNAEQIRKTNGELSSDQIGDLLNPRDYPPECHFIWLELMRKFELCFKFTADDERYLIPELLDKQEPAETEAFRSADCLNFQYHYQTLPEGLIPRFIVRTHVLSAGQPRWRSGVILHFERSQALIKADYNNRRVLISVKGSETGRSRLLAIIRSDFSAIHHRLDFEPQEMVPVPGHPNLCVPYRELLVMEQEGIHKFTRVDAGRVLRLNVSELLNGVDLNEKRQTSFSVEPEEEGLFVFVSYCHKDEQLREEFEVHLKLLERDNLIQAWHFREITAGEEWQKVTDKQLERAHIILLLISPDFLASEFCQAEMKRALQRQKESGVKVIPIILRDVRWKHKAIGKLEALPTGGTPVVKWQDRDTAWRDVEAGIAKVAERMLGDSP